ncbi:transposable element Tc3 transposase [Trichonephila clavipes]|nr:transposable element Tc3 transposase [Trichonephila clavipes]
MRICHRWIQKKTTDRRGQSHSFCYITIRDDRRIVCMVGMDCAATSRAIAQQVQSVTHHSVSTRTIPRRLQQSGMFVASLETTTEWNGIVFTDKSLLKCCVMHRHNGLAPSITVWGGIGFHCHTPLVRIACTLNSQCYIFEMLEPVVLPYIQRLSLAEFRQDNA